MHFRSFQTFNRGIKYPEEFLDIIHRSPKEEKERVSRATVESGERERGRGGIPCRRSRRRSPLWSCRPPFYIPLLCSLVHLFCCQHAERYRGGARRCFPHLFPHFLNGKRCSKEAHRHPSPILGEWINATGCFAISVPFLILNNFFISGPIIKPFDSIEVEMIRICLVYKTPCIIQFF